MALVTILMRTHKLCLIYENRPLVCRVEQYYQTYLKEIYEWEEFVKLNLEICQKL